MIEMSGTAVSGGQALTGVGKLIFSQVVVTTCRSSRSEYLRSASRSQSHSDTIIVIHGLKSKIKLDESADGQPRHSYCNNLCAKVGARDGEQAFVLKDPCK